VEPTAADLEAEPTKDYYIRLSQHLQRRVAALEAAAAHADALATAVLAKYDDATQCYGCGAIVRHTDRGVREMRHLATDCVVLKAFEYRAHLRGGPV
jgi:hypothetical protein